MALCLENSPGPLERAVVKLYAEQGAWRQFYARFRIALARFDQIGSFVPTRGTILDVGCGYGVLANYLALAAPERRVVGLDLNARRIRIARETIGQRTNISFQVGNALEHALPECDGIIASDVLHHLPLLLQEQLLTRLAALLRPDGILVIQEVNMEPLWKYWCSHTADLALYPLEERPHFRSSRDWLAVLAERGFNHVGVVPGDAGTVFARVSYLARK